MRAFTKFSLRFLAYLLVLSYLAADLFLFEGPLHRRLQASDLNSPESIAAAKANGVVARVFNHHITSRQLDYAVYERLWLEGKTLKDLTPSDKKLVTYAALGDLIDHELLRVKVKVNTLELPVSDKEIDERLDRFVGKFQSRGHLKTAMVAMGIHDGKALRNRIAARIQQEKYVAMRIAPLVEVTESEIDEWYLANKASLVIPERIRLSHIFVATLDRPPEDAERILQGALAEINAHSKDFTTLAREISDDSSTKDSGGDLGWMSRIRLPQDFAEKVFALADDKPALIRTKLGWHLVILTGRMPPAERSIESARPEILAALTAAKRHAAVAAFRTSLRKFEAHKIDVFHDRLAL